MGLGSNPCLGTEIEGRVDHLARRLHEAGKITDLHADADVFHRLTLIEQQFAGASGTSAFSSSKPLQARQILTLRLSSSPPPPLTASPYPHLGGDG